MKVLNPALATHLNARQGQTPHALVWINAKDRSTGLPVTLGLWTGDDDRSFTIGAESRTYLGAGALLDVGDITAETGYVVRIQRISLAHLAPQVAAALGQCDVRLAPVEIHQVHLAPGSHDLIAAARQMFKGQIEVISFPTPQAGGDAAAEAEAVSYARAMTRPLTLKSSQAALSARAPADFALRYQALQMAVKTSWGEKS